jgi:hypothetical protein
MFKVTDGRVEAVESLFRRENGFVSDALRLPETENRKSGSSLLPENGFK